MNHKLMIAVCLGALVPVQAARADVVSDRVFLVTGSSGCPTGWVGFKRIRQSPDGSQVPETAEFQVPAGKYLEITSVEYTTPYHTPWAKFYAQQLSLNIRQRAGSATTNIFSAVFQNRTMFDEDANDNFNGFGQYVSPGAETHVASFPVGPLMSNNGRLCFQASSNFYTFGGWIRVRGRLIATGEIIVGPPGGGVLDQ